MSQIIQMVSDAAATKAPIAKIADRVSGVFVPIVIMIAVVTIVVWLLLGQDIGYALARGISVLVISCPCSLGLATPVAIMVGNGKAPAAVSCSRPRHRWNKRAKRRSSHWIRPAPSPAVSLK